jgi:hypothetical protein
MAHLRNTILTIFNSHESANRSNSLNTVEERDKTRCSDTRAIDIEHRIRITYIERKRL